MHGLGLADMAQITDEAVERFRKVYAMETYVEFVNGEDLC